MTRVMRLVAILIAGALAPVRAAAQPAPLEPTPIECWWRTSAGAVRVGEPFTFVLTCAVVETDAVTIVPDQSRLDPSVAQMTPFEVLGGSHGPDVRGGDRRFFQYEYTLRLVGDDLFGRDVKLPEMRIPYRIQTRAARGASIEGRERTYTVPPESIRVLSTVPADATAIREAPAETLASIDTRAFRANALMIMGAVLLALGGLCAILALVKLAQRYRRAAPDTRHLVVDRAILRQAAAELSAIKREREGGGWTPDLAARALSALRIVASCAVDRPVGQTTAPSSANGAAAGSLLVRRRWIGGEHVLVSGSMTAPRLAAARRQMSQNGRGPSADILDTLEAALGRFTRAQYGRDDRALDAADLDEALAGGERAARRMARERSWLMTHVAAVARAARGSRRWVR